MPIAFIAGPLLTAELSQMQHNSSCKDVFGEVYSGKGRYDFLPVITFGFGTTDKFCCKISAVGVFLSQLSCFCYMSFISLNV